MPTAYYERLDAHALLRCALRPGPRGQGDPGPGDGTGQLVQRPEPVLRKRFAADRFVFILILPILTSLSAARSRP